MAPRAVVTGAFSYIGSAVAGELGARGYDVHTLTNRRAPEGTQVTAAPLRFEERHLVAELRDADVFVNTYWIRFPHGGQTFESAVANHRLLVEAAAAAGVRRFVHVSVSNPARGLNLGYYAGKAKMEETLRSSSLSHAIVRPTLVVGRNDILTNNIVWLLRRFPVFPVPRGGHYRLQPVTLEDTGRIVADAAEVSGNVTWDAAGPDVVTFREYLALLSGACRVRRLMFPAPNWLALAGLRLIGPFLRDVVLTREELLGLQQELLLSHEPPRGTESVGDWLTAHGAGLGRTYANDLRRHFGAGRSEAVADRGSPV